jgi:hypothetical protein
MRLWKRPDTPAKWMAFILGATLFWLMLPVWILCMFFWWRGDSLFVVRHLEALFYNPWLIKQ